MQYLAAPAMDSNILAMFSRVRLARVVPEARLGLDPSNNPTKNNQPVYCLSLNVKQNERNKTQRRGGIGRRRAEIFYT